MISPTSSDAVTAFVYQDFSLPTWVLTAQQFSSLCGSLLGGVAMWRFNRSVDVNLPIGAVAQAAAALSGLILVSEKQYVYIILQPFVDAFLSRCGFMVVLFVASAASSKGRRAQRMAW